MENKYETSGYTKDPGALHLYVKDIRILTPKEYETLKAMIPKDFHKTIFDILLITGMRYIEMLRLYEHKEWYNEKRNLIHLPEEAQKKSKRRQLERTIHPLPSMFSYILKDFWEGKKPPLEATWNKNLQRWAIAAGINPYGLSVKTTRKTLESWMLATGIPPFKVYQRQGHDPETSLYHYQGLSFTDLEMDQIKKRLMEWGILRSDKI